MQHENRSRQSIARLAGCLYLTVVLTGIFGIAYVPSQLIIASDPAQTISRLSSSTSLFRWGIASNLVCYLAFLLLPLALYQLLNTVHRTAAQLMVALAVVSVPISLYNLTHKLQVLELLSGAGQFPEKGGSNLQDQIMNLLAHYDSGVLISQLFWGLWLLPLGYLILRSGVVPKVLGVLLVLGCAGYLLVTFGKILDPLYTERVWRKYVTLPASAGEIGTCLWLLIAGIREPKKSVQNAEGISR